MKSPFVPRMMMSAGSVLVLAAILATALAGPINVRELDGRRACAKTCAGTSKFNFAPGTTYEFEYNVQTQTSMEGASSDSAVIGIRATADIEVLSKCEMALVLREVRLYQSDPSSSAPMKQSEFTEEFRRNLERFPLRFSYQDGVVEDLCPSEGESTWALNVKRGLLTVIQNSMEHLNRDQRIKEKDVTGNCYTDYKKGSVGWYGSSTTIKKVKDMMGCTDRHGYQGSVHSMPYSVPSDIQSLPLVNSSHENEQEWDSSGLLKSSLTRETHTFKPFSRATSGATTKVLQKLNYKNQRYGTSVRPDVIDSRTDLIYEHVDGSGRRVDARRDAENKLQEICQNTREDIRPDTPSLFSELVYIMKSMDVAAINSVFSQLKRGKLCSDNNERIKKFFLDAIPMASTGAAVDVLTDLLINKEVTGSQADMWIGSLAFIQHPTLEMLEKVKRLVDSSDLSLNAMLPASTLVNNYCSHHHDCADEYAIANIISSLETNIGYGCHVRDKKLEAIMITLRALGNAGHIPRIVDSIRNCFTKANNPIDVRVAAIEAFRRLPCTADRDDLMSIYKDTDEDSEVRIAAYLGLMQCPTEQVLERIQEALSNEEVKQVGSFVWSHLSNLKETSSPHKQSIRAILQNKVLQKEFDLEAFMYSRNYEASMFLEKFNTGAAADSNLIFSESSFIPRSAMLNLTLDLFGNSVNLLELGGRIEGLEYIIETYLGPYGYFGDQKTKMTSKQNEKNMEKLRGSLYMRMFGNEMMYKHIKGMDSISAGARSFNYLDLLIKMSKKHDYSFTQSVMFLDSRMIIPTSCGLPLNLTVNGTATVDVQARGQIDLRKVATKPRSLLVDGTIKPSGAVSITGTMSMDAFVTKTGLRIVNTWHSSTSLTGRVELTRGKILTAEIDMPQKKMELFDVQTRFFTLHGGVEQEEKLITDNRKSLKMCTGNRVAAITGLWLCSEIQWSNASMIEKAPYFPFTGPFSYSMALHKTDTHSGYTLMYKRTESKQSSIAQLTFDTPGSKIDRALSFDMDVNYKNKVMKFEMISPWKIATIKGNLKTDKNLMGAEGSMMIDLKNNYAFISDLKISKAKDVVTYKPRLEISRPGVKDIRLVGSLATHGMRKAIVDVSFAGITNNTIVLKANVQNSKIEKSIEAGINLGGKGDYSIEGSFVHRDIGKRNPIIRIIPNFIVKTPETNLLKFTGNALYKPQKSLNSEMSLFIHKLINKPITMSCNVNKARAKNTKYTGNAKLRSKFVNFKLQGSVEKKKKTTISSKFSIDYSVPMFKFIKPNKIDISTKFQNRSTISTLKYAINGNFISKKYQDWNFYTNIGLVHNQKQTNGKLELTCGKNIKDESRKLTTSVEVIHDISQKKHASITYDLIAKYPLKQVNLRLKGNHTHNNKNLDSKVKLDYGGNAPLNVKLSMKDSSRKNLKMTGSIDLTSEFKKFNLKTDLTQTKKDYTHQVTLLVDEHTIKATTRYRKQKGTYHNVQSDIKVPFMEPLSVEGALNLDRNNFKISGEGFYAKQLYRASSAYKYTKEPKGRWSLDVVHPARHVVVEVEGGKKGTTYSGSVETQWDAERDNQKKMTFGAHMNVKGIDDIDSSATLKYPSRVLKLNFNHKGGKAYTSHADFSWTSKKQISLDTMFRLSKNMNSNGSLRLQTPFKGYEDVSAEVSNDNRPGKLISRGQYAWGKKNVAGSFILKKPYTFRNIEASISAATPFVGFRKMNTDIVHKLESNKLVTNIKGRVDSKHAEVNMLLQNNEIANSRNVEANLALTSNIKNMKRMSMEVTHKDDNKKFQTDFIVDINGDRYVYDLDMTHTLAGWHYENDGTLTISYPSSTTTSTWKHSNTLNDISTSLRSELGRGKKINLILNAKHMSADTTSTSGSLSLETPWEPIRQVDVSLDNTFGSEFIRSSSSLKMDRAVVTSSNINYKRSAGNSELDFIITSPFSDDLIFKTNARYNMLPITGHAQFEWGPHKMVSADGSINMESLDKMEGELRMTSPHDYMRNVLLKASHNYENDEWLSTILLDYAPTKAIEVESRIAMGALQKVRITITTPFSSFSRMDTGLEYSGGLLAFNSKADLTIEPTVGTYSTTANWILENAELNGKLRVDTPLQDYRYYQMTVLSQNSGNGKRHTRAEAEYYPRKTMSFDLTHRLDSPIIVDAVMETPFKYLEHIDVSFKHALRRHGMQTLAEITYAPSKTIVGNLELKWKNSVSGSFTAITPYSGKSKIMFRHDGPLTDFTCHAEIEHNKQTVEADVEFEHGDRTTGQFIVKTPFAGFEETKGTIKRRGGIRDVVSGLTLNYGRQQKIVVSFDNTWTPEKKTTELNIHSPLSEDVKLSIAHDGRLARFSTKVEGSYGETYSIASTTGLTITSTNIDFTSHNHVRSTAKPRTIILAFQKDGPLNDMNSRLTINCNEHELHIDGVLKMVNDIESSVMLKTKMYDIKQKMGISIKHVIQTQGFTSVGTVEYPGSQMIQGKAVFNHNGIRQIGTDVELTTPFSGKQTVSYKHNLRETEMTAVAEVTYGHRQTITAEISASSVPKINVVANLKTPFQNMENNRFVFTHEGAMGNCKLHAGIDTERNIMNLDLDTTMNDQLIKADVAIKTNIDGYEVITASAMKEGTLRNLKMAGLLSLGDAVLDVKLTHRLTKRRIVTEFVLKNPYTEEITFNINHNSNLPNFNTVVSANMGPSAGVLGSASLKQRGTTFNVEGDLSYTLAGTGSRQSIKLGKDGDIDNLSGYATVSWKEQTIDVKGQLRTGDKIHGEVTVETPFESYRNLAIIVDHTGDINDFASEGIVRYMDYKEISGKVNHNYRSRRLDSSVVVNTPFRGFEMTELTYTHKGRWNSFDCNAELDVGHEKFSTHLRFSKSPKYDIYVNFTPSLFGFKSASGSLDLQTDRYVFESEIVQVRNGNTFSLESTVDMTTSPMTANVHLKTPSELVGDNDVTITHEGQWMDFRSTMNLLAPKLCNITGEASLKYESAFDMNALIKLEGMKVQIENSVQGDRYRSHIETVWEDDRAIDLEGSYHYTDSWYEKELEVEATMTTPFEVAKQTGFKIKHTQGSDKYTQTVEVDYNGDTIVDVDMEYTKEKKHECVVNFRKPKAMQYTISGQLDDNTIDTELFINWDRDEHESNVRFQTYLNAISGSSGTSKSMKVKLIHPARTLGVVGSMDTSASNTKSVGQFIWNEDDGGVISYDVDLTDKSRRSRTMYDGALKVGTPLRDFKVDGSFSDGRGRKVVDGTFSWDAVADTSKQIGFKAVLSPSDFGKKAELSLKLPSIGKDIKLDTEMTMNNGRTILGGQTRFSYSRDPKKTLTIASKVEDISHSYDTKNYSVVMEMSHPYTNVDIRMDSNIGRSPDKFTGGMNVMYMTARRERKNFALRGEIDRIRNQLNIQMESPLKNIALSGEVSTTNPYVLKLTNAQDGIRAIYSELTLDTERRFIKMQTNYDMDKPHHTINIYANYINSTAVRADLYRAFDSDKTTTESLIAIRLNTTRILHTRIHWRPEVVQELQGYLMQRIENYGGATKVSFQEVYEAVGKEIDGKYRRIAMAFNEDIAPFVQLLESEMAGVEKQLTILRRDLKRMYDRNDLNIASMKEAFLVAFEQYKEFVSVTKGYFNLVSQSISVYLENVKNYPIRDEYRRLVTDALLEIKMAIDRSVSTAVAVVARWDEHLKEMVEGTRNGISDTMTKIKNHPKIAALRYKLSDIDYQRFINIAQEKVNSFNIPQKYSSVIYSARDVFNRKLENILSREDVRNMKSLTNELYQEGLWAYNYWQVEENLRKHVTSISKLLTELVTEEIEQYRNQLNFLEKSRVTVWDPEHGEIQMEIYLPIPLQTLDSLPQVDQYVVMATRAVNKYIPEKKTVTHYYDKYMPNLRWASPNQTKSNSSEFKAELSEFMQAKTKARRTLRRYEAQSI